MSFHRSRAGTRLLPRFAFYALILSAALVQLVTRNATASSGPKLGIDVDARDLPRRLVHTRIQVPCQPGELKLWFPKWVPGTHGPCGPIQNVGGLYVETPDGKKLDWRRDDIELYRIVCQV